MSMTEEQLATYLAEPNICPFCESNNLDTEGFSPGHNTVSQDVICLECEESWVDQYTLTGVDD